MYIHIQAQTEQENAVLEDLVRYIAKDLGKYEWIPVLRVESTPHQDARLCPCGRALKMEGLQYCAACEIDMASAEQEPMCCQAPAMKETKDGPVCVSCGHSPGGAKRCVSFECEHPSEEDSLFCKHCRRA